MVVYVQSCRTGIVDDIFRTRWVAWSDEPRTSAKCAGTRKRAIRRVRKAAEAAESSWLDRPVEAVEV